MYAGRGAGTRNCGHCGAILGAGIMDASCRGIKLRISGTQGNRILIPAVPFETLAEPVPSKARGYLLRRAALSPHP